MKDLNFSEDIKVNKFKLDEVCEKHASSYLYYSHLLAEEKDKKDRKSLQIDRMKAELDLELRKKWEVHTRTEGIPKMTESAITALISSDKDIQEEEDRLFEIKNSVDVLEKAVKAFEQRKDMINNLIYLHTRGYFAAPNGGKKRNIADEASDNVRSNINRRMKDGKKKE